MVVVTVVVAAVVVVVMILVVVAVGTAVFGTNFGGCGVCYGAICEQQQQEQFASSHVVDIGGHQDEPQAVKLCAVGSGVVQRQ